MEENSLKFKAVVIDNGSYLSKIGFAGEKRPRSVFHTAIGYHKHEEYMEDIAQYTQKYYVGEDMMHHKDALELKFPLVYRLNKTSRYYPTISYHLAFEGWSVMEKIWHYTFYKVLNIDPSEHPVLLTESPLLRRPDREKMAEIMFETFNIPALYIGMQAVLSAYATGRTEGAVCVVNIGDSITSVVPMYSTAPLTHAIFSRELAGRDVTNNLQQLLRQKGYSFPTSIERDIVRDIKEKLCYIALDPEKELMLSKGMSGMDRSYILPNGNPINIDVERFLAPECLFNPSVIGKNLEPLDELIVRAIRNCEIDLERDLCGNIVLSGGSTMFPGLKERLMKKIKEQIPESVDVTIIDAPDRMYSAWIGGSIVASLESSKKMWVTQREYKKEGPQIIHRCSCY
ncbi:MAG: actin, cytoplasmic 2 [Promethearchaeota archaeon]